VVDNESASKIRGSHLALRILQETGKPALQSSHGHMATAQTAQGKCVFLDPQQLCSIQSELGSGSKPTGCHKFPFQFCRTPDGFYVGISFYCSAAQRNQGRPLGVHESGLAQLLSEEDLLGDDPLPVHGKVTLEWEGYRVLEERLVARGTAGLEEALAGLCDLVIRAGRRRHQLGAADIIGRGGCRGIDFTAVPLRRAYCTWLGRLEATTMGQLPALGQALLDEQPIRFQRFGNWTGCLSSVEEAGRLDPWALEELERYLKALLFRKFLVMERPVLHNLALLYLLPNLFKACVGLSRLSRVAPSLEAVDIYRAFDECEYTYMTHATGLDRPLAELGRTFLAHFMARTEL
jgi:hypothetical protein